MKTQILDGPWQLAAVAGPGTRLEQVDTWLEMDVPSHWQQHEQLRHHAGTVLYRRRFEGKPKKGERYFLVLPGTFYYATVFFNGRRLGDYEGYFAPHRYDVTDLYAKENELVVEVTCPDEKKRNNKRMLTGVFSHWDCLDPTTNPGGLWRAPEIHTSGNAYLDRCLWQVDELDGDDATVTTRLEIRAYAAGRVQCEIMLEPDGFEGESYRFTQEMELDAGRNKLAFSHVLHGPALWWPAELGEPRLYKLTVTLKDGRKKSDEFEDRVGVRTVRWDDWVFYVNDRRLYLRGSNHPPTDTRLATVTREAAERDVRLALEANMNMLRVHAHVDHPELYRAADRAGLLLWQDFPMQWSYSREVLPVAEKMLPAMIKLLFNHPSVVIWTCHNEPLYLEETDDETPTEVAKTAFSLLFYSWNRNVLDKALQKAGRLVDTSRPVNRSSGELWLPWQRGTDTHFYFGWYRIQGKSMYNFDFIRRRLPKNLQFVTEFGAQSFPNLESCHRFMHEDIARIDWNELEDKHSLQKELMDCWVGLAQPDLATLVEKSQAYQSEINRFYIDRLRLAKYKPNGGILQFMFTDPNPAIQWSVLDYWREPKASYQALADAFRPVYAFVILDRPVRRVGDKPLGVEAYVVNDTHEPLGETALHLTITDPVGHVVADQRVAVTVKADSPAIRALALDESPETPGEYTVTLTLQVEDRPDFVNVYTFTVE